jgi:hypothetical protein
MRKRQILCALLSLFISGLIIGWALAPWPVGDDPIQKLTQIEETASSIAQSPFTGEHIKMPQVDPDRLQSDLNALAFERFTDAQRAQAREYIQQVLADAGWSVQSHDFETGVNLYAERPGTDPNAGTILLGAHYDTVPRSPGADDNASGVVVVLEAARLLRDMSTTRTLKLVFFDLEELGLLGSQAFASDDQLTDHVQGALIMEMLGYSCDQPGCQRYPQGLPIDPPSDRGDFIAVVGNQQDAQLIDAFQSTHGSLPNLVKLAIPISVPILPDLLRSDHVPFWREGIGAVMVTDTANFRNPHYHQPSDTVETLDLDFLSGTAQIVIDAVTRLLKPANL